MELYFAPLEGINGAEYRRAHRRYFPGVDKYYAPFLSPTQDHRFTPRELRNILPEQNPGIPLVPQLMTKNVEDFLWAAEELRQMGYSEVNLNLGCPSGTVVAKGKGAGMLADPENLNEFLYQIFQKVEVSISIKTRLGFIHPEEFRRLLQIFSRYPIALLILHPRVRKDFYREPIRMEYFDQVVQDYDGPLCYNGGLTSVRGISSFAASHPPISRVMLGQGLVANPALATQTKGLGTLERETLHAFHDELYHSYLDAFVSERNTVFHMKELWHYMSHLFSGGETLFKQIKKAQDSHVYEQAVEEIFRSLPIHPDTDWS